MTRIPGLDVAYGIVNADAALRDAGSGTPAPDTHVELEPFTDASPVGKDVEVRATVTDRSDAGSAANAQLAISLSPTLKFRQAWGGTTGCTPTTNAVTLCAVGVVSPGQPREVTIRAIVTAAGPQTISVSVSHASTDANPADNAVTLTFKSTATRPNVWITNLRGPGAPVVGGELEASVAPVGATLSHRWQLCRTGPPRGKKAPAPTYPVPPSPFSRSARPTPAPGFA